LQRQRLRHRRALTAGAAFVAVSLVAAGLYVRDDARAVSFAADVQPIFDRKCTTCHPVSYPYLDLRPGRAYDSLVRVSAATAPAFERVLPGRPELSYVLTHPPDPSLRDLLTPRERATIAAWISEGAPNN
jgi:hypothetical protein